MGYVKRGRLRQKVVQGIFQSPPGVNGRWQETALKLTNRSIFLFWVPLAATWIMMSVEGPFLAAIIARLPDPKFNLAAYGVAFAFAILVESPVIMMMSASTALVENWESYRKLRNFTFTLSAAITGVMLVVLIPAVSEFLLVRLIGLPERVARLTHGSLMILLPWPGVIGYRRFYQGLLIRSGRTRWVAFGTVVRLVTMGTTALLVYRLSSLEGAHVGAVALSAGVTAEAIASRIMTHSSVRELAARTMAGTGSMSYRDITVFYYPLALTSLIGLTVHPMVTFFMGRARFPVESLAVFPVVNSLSFIFRSVGLSFQEATIALLGDGHRHFRELGRFALLLAVVSSLGLALIAFTPMVHIWYEGISGLTPDLSRFTIVPTRILVVLPFLSVLLSYERGILVNGRRTRPITYGTMIEVSGIAILFLSLIKGFDMVGVTAAVTAFVGGRLRHVGCVVGVVHHFLDGRLIDVGMEGPRFVDHDRS